MYYYHEWRNFSLTKPYPLYFEAKEAPAASDIMLF